MGDESISNREKRALVEAAKEVGIREGYDYQWQCQGAGNGRWNNYIDRHGMGLSPYRLAVLISRAKMKYKLNLLLS
jgi:hypothetical protein